MGYKTRIALLVWAVGPCAIAQDYADGKGGNVSIPLGDVSFADEVVSFEKGSPAAPEKNSRPEQALGRPDYDKKTNYVTLGCGGSLSLRFTDNALVDVDGPDLYVFEIGPKIEATQLSLSTDGEHWVDVGTISGGSAQVDIHAWASAGDAFHFVRLTDRKSACGGNWPGADIDAVGAIGGGLVISLDGAVLFDVDQFVLRPAAERVLQDAAQKIGTDPKSRILIDGHTDSDGSPEHNQELSENRAQAVRDYLVTAADVDAARIQVHGYGETRPIASNDTKEGREKNRRVEIVAIP